MTTEIPSTGARSPESRRRKLRLFNSTFDPIEDPDTAGQPYDFIIVVAHGAAPSSNVLADNLDSFLTTLEQISEYWFWELKLKFHVELIDWKSVLFPYQNEALTRVIPTEDPIAPGMAAGVAPPAKSYSLLTSLFSSAPTRTPPPSIETESISKITVEQEDVETGESNLVMPPRKAGEADQPQPQNLSDKSQSQRTPCMPFEDLARRHGLRIYFHNVVGDVLCYMTPRYGNFMLAKLSQLMNRKIENLRRDPSGKFRNSKVILIGHSLGSVMLYELLTGYPFRETASSAAESPDYGTPEEPRLFPDLELPPVIPADSHIHRLDFHAESLFMWGSPLAAFHILRNKPSDVQAGAVLPNGTRLYNIYHRQDPVALRMEPVFFPEPNPMFPPPVAIPYFKTNSTASWRKNLRTVSNANELKAATQSVFRRLFAGTDPNRPVTGLTAAEYKEIVRSARYRLPDRLHKASRYGKTHLESHTSAGLKLETRYEIAARKLGPRGGSEGPGTRGEEEIFDFSDSSSLSESDRLESDEEGAGVADLAGERGASTPVVSSTTPVPAEDARSTTSQEQRESISSQFMIAKGDLGLNNKRLSAREEQIETADIYPWTNRQFVAHVARRLRKRFLRRLERRLADRVILSQVPVIRAKMCKAIDDEIEEFIAATTKTSKPTVLDPDMPSVKVGNSYTAEDGNAWLASHKVCDLQRLEEACRQEIELEMANDEISEDEAGGGDMLPVRVDFCVSESIQQFLFAPLGLLASHLNYWSCKDSCFFFLKEITGFRPRMSSEKRNLILARAKDARRHLTRKLNSLTPQSR